jgi:hypothetical protein
VFPVRYRLDLFILFRRGTNVRVLVFSAGLLARSQFASGRSCDLTTPKFFFVPRTNAKLVLKFHVAPHTSHVALQMLAQSFTIMEPFQRAKSFTLSQTYIY